MYNPAKGGWCGTSRKQTLPWGHHPELQCFTPFLLGALASEGGVTPETLARFLPFCVDLLPQVCSSEFFFCFPARTLSGKDTDLSGRDVLCREGGEERTLGWCFVTGHCQAGAGPKQVWSRGVQELRKPLQPQRWTQLWVSPMTVCNSGQHSSVQSNCS